jgi:Domain of unknown function (DUF4267)
MLQKKIGTGLTALLAGGIITVGAGYVRGAHSIIDGFGLPGWAEAPEPAYWIKGARDISSGVVPLVLLALGQRRALGWVLAAEALVPLGDMTTVLTHQGSARTALGVHGATAATMLVTAGLILTEGS